MSDDQIDQLRQRLQVQLNEHQEQLNSVFRMIETMLKTKDATNTILDTLTNRIEQVSYRLTKYEAIQDNLRSRIEALECDSEVIKGAISVHDGFERDIAALKADLDDLEGAVNDLRSDFDDLD